MKSESLDSGCQIKYVLKYKFWTLESNRILPASKQHKALPKAINTTQFVLGKASPYIGRYNFQLTDGDLALGAFWGRTQGYFA